MIAAFIAIALSGPVNALSQHMRRGSPPRSAWSSLLIPIGIRAADPQHGEPGEELANNAPQYAEDVTDFVNRNETLSNLNQDYDITGKIEEEAAKLPDKIPDAAGTLQDIGVGFVNSVFAALTIFILSIFMVASGRYWIERFLETRHPDQKARMERALDTGRQSETTSAARSYRQRSRASPRSSC